MTIIKEIELGEDLKELLKEHPDFYNISNIKSENIEENTLYYVEKHIGFYPPFNKSGIFVLCLRIIDDNFIENIW